MMTRLLRIVNSLLVLLLVGCSSLAPLIAPRTPTSAPVLQATSTPQAIPTSTVQTTTNQPHILRVWLPVQFDPDAGTPSADLLKQRLLAFEDEYPNVQIEIRIKSNADILNTLSITNSAAPEAMPDLIALSYSDMHATASAGFLHPLEGLTSILQEPDWYAFARELGHFKNTEYGIPFAVDILLMVYRSAVFDQVPATWESLLESGTYFVFPVSDPRASFSLSLYLSVGGQIVDDQSAITLDEESLIRLFSFYKQAIETDTILLSTRDFQTDVQSLQFFRDGRADLAVIWASSDILTQSGDYIPLLGLENTNYSLGDGWVWTLAGSSAEKQPLAAELASYLVESSFMSEWTRVSGFLPTRPKALDGWSNEGMKISLNEALQSAYPIPPDDVMSVLGPLLQGALVRIFNGEQPEVVARSVIENLP